MEKLSNEQAILKSKEIWGDFYDYSKFEYVNARTKIELICPYHGNFKQIFNTHLRSGCYQCGCKKRRNLEIFNIFNEVHNYKYDYSKSIYNGLRNKILIICPVHGEFEMNAGTHKNGSGCRKCSIDSQKSTTEEFIKKAKEIHGNKYDYSLVEYGNNNTDFIKIKCKHGIFRQRIHNHLSGNGCLKCYKENFISKWKEKCSEYHNSKYDYSKVNYLHSKKKVIIICPYHGEFKQMPKTHLNHGCPICRSSKGELDIIKILDKYNIKYNKEYSFKDCKFKKNLPFDFYLPTRNICIEYNGEQHYKSINFFGGLNRYNEQVKKDNIKLNFCEFNNINLIIVKYDDNIEDKLKFLNEK